MAELKNRNISDPHVFMQTVIGEIKEIPELPSEAPKDSTFITNVDFPEEGGVLTYMDGHDEPFRGFPFHEFVDKVDTLKKIGRGMLSSLFHSIKKRNKFELALLVFTPWLFEALLLGGLYAANRIVSRFKFKKDKYSQAVRELHRVLSLEKGEVREIIRDLLCMTLENDNAYRFRFQDIIVNLDKVALKKNVSKEVVRLLTLMQSREKNVDVSDTWTLLKTFLPMYLFVNRKLRKELAFILGEINLGEVELTKEDKWFCYPRSDYHFGFVLNQAEADKDIIARFEAKKRRDEETKRIREESTKAHQELFARHRVELPLGERDQQVVKLDQELQNSLNEKARIAYVEGQMKNREAVLSLKELDILKRQLQEIAEMDEHYNKQLQAL